MLELKNIVKYFDKGTPSETIAINHLNLKIGQGEFITVIGGNGAGKSTLLNIIAGSIESDSGLVLLNNNDISFMSEHKRAPYFGRVFQDPMSGTATDMSIIENLTIAYGRGRPRTIFRWFINKKEKEYFVEQLKTLDLGLEKRLGDKVGLLSGGQRQALTLLMATIRQKPTNSTIKRDYVRFCETDKAEAKKEVLAGFSLAKEEKKKAIASLSTQKMGITRKEANKQIREEKLKFASIKDNKKEDIKLIMSNKEISKDEQKEKCLSIKQDIAFERAKCWDIIAKIKSTMTSNVRKEARAKINQEYEQKISKFDLTKQILLLDEHTAALDPKTAAKVLDITERIVNENNLTTIMITHNMKDAIRYGNRLIMMSHGKVVVDIKGEEKKKLTVEQLLEMFQKASKDDFLSDSAILG